MASVKPVRPEVCPTVDNDVAATRGKTTVLAVVPVVLPSIVQVWLLISPVKLTVPSVAEALN